MDFKEYLTEAKKKKVKIDVSKILKKNKTKIAKIEKIAKEYGMKPVKKYKSESGIISLAKFENKKEMSEVEIYIDDDDTKGQNVQIGYLAYGGPSGAGDDISYWLKKKTWEENGFGDDEEDEW